MSNRLFNRYLDKARRSGINPNGSKESIDWFRRVVTKDGSIGNIGKVTENLYRAKFVPGEMITYSYDPKLADELDHYDTHPLIIYLDNTKDGWYGLNIHYMPPVVRAKIFSELHYNSKSLQSIAKSLSADSRLKVCLKRYIARQVMDKPMKIPKDVWQIAISLPYDKFEKMSKKSVWNSIKKRK